jgi:hypothetical protein
MPSVTVTAITAFEYEGRDIARGDALVIDPPVKALVLARQGKVSLARQYLTRAIQPDPEPPQPTRRRRRKSEEADAPKRRYRRRDMTAETE